MEICYSRSYLLETFGNTDSDLAGDLEDGITANGYNFMMCGGAELVLMKRNNCSDFYFRS